MYAPGRPSTWKSSAASVSSPARHRILQPCPPRAIPPGRTRLILFGRAWVQHDHHHRRTGRFGKEHGVAATGATARLRVSRHRRHVSRGDAGRPRSRHRPHQRGGPDQFARPVRLTNARQPGAAEWPGCQLGDPHAARHGGVSRNLGQSRCAKAFGPTSAPDGDWKEYCLRGPRSGHDCLSRCGM